MRIFTHPTLGAVRATLSASNEPLICGIDLAHAVGYSRQTSVNIPHMADATDLTRIPIGPANVWFLNELGVESFLDRTTKPKAGDVARWLDNEVFPALKGQPVIKKTKDTDTLKNITRCLFSLQDSFLKHIGGTDTAKDFEDRFTEAMSDLVGVIGERIGLETVEACFSKP